MTWQDRLAVATNRYIEKNSGCLFLTTVAHDDDCPVISNGGECCCEPNIVLVRHRDRKQFVVDPEGQLVDHATLN